MEHSTYRKELMALQAALQTEILQRKALKAQMESLQEALQAVQKEIKCDVYDFCKTNRDAISNNKTERLFSVQDLEALEKRLSALTDRVLRMENYLKSRMVF